MRKTRVISPVTDLFIALALLFFVLFVTKPQAAPTTGSSDTGSTDAIHYQRLRHGKDAAFKFGGATLTLEGALHTRQTIYNKIYRLRHEWRNTNKVEESRLHFRIVTNSDPLLTDNWFGNWQTSADRALSIMHTGFCPTSRFQDILAKTVLAAHTATKYGKDEAVYPSPTPYANWISGYSETRGPRQWLYAYESSSHPYTPRIIAYACLWFTSNGSSAAALYRRAKYDRTEAVILHEGQVPPPLRRAMRYREETGHAPMDNGTLFDILDSTWKIARTSQHAALIDRDGMFFEQPLPDPKDVTPTSGLRSSHAEQEESLYAFIPFFQFSTKGSYDSFSPNDNRLEALLTTLHSRMQNQIGTDDSPATWRTPGRIKHLLGLGQSLLTLPEVYPNETLSAYFHRNERAIKFLIACQLSRGYDIFDIENETINKETTFHIQAVLEQTALHAAFQSNGLNIHFGSESNNRNTRKRLEIFREIHREYTINAHRLASLARFKNLLPKIVKDTKSGAGEAPE